MQVFGIVDFLVIGATLKGFPGDGSKAECNNVPEMQIIPLNDCPPEKLDPLFEEEIHHWSESVFWDYRSTLNVIKGFILGKTLPGFALMSGDNAVGYSYFVVDRPVSFIGGLYVINECAGPETYALLLERTASTITGAPNVERVETQLFEFNYRFRSLFDACGFRPRRRHFLVCDLNSALIPAIEDLGDGKPAWRFIRWQDKFIGSAAEVIYDSYQGSYDSTICWDYQSRQGCLRFVRNLIENPACGQFFGEDTLVALDSRGQLCGILLGTRISRGTAMIPQISIRRDCQGRGLGSAMLNTYLAHCREQGLARVTLSVSEGNDRAFRLYQRKGFEILKSFHAFIWDRAQVA